VADKASFAVDLRDEVSKNAKKASMALGDLSKSLDRAERDSKGLGGLRGKISGVGQELDQARQKSDSFLGSMLKFEALKASARAVLGVGSALLESAAFSDRMGLAFDQLTHGHGAETLEHTRRAAEMLGLDVHDTTKAYKNFLALQFKPAAADKLLAIGADMQALGSSAEEVQGIFIALGQIKAKGRVQAQELLQLSERGVSQQLIQEEGAQVLGLVDEKEVARLKALGKEGEGALEELFKKGRQEVMKMQEAGKFGADDFFIAFERAINRKLGQSELGESGKKFANETIAGMINVAKAKATNIFDAIVKRDDVREAVKSTVSELERFALSKEGISTFKAGATAVSSLFHAVKVGVPVLVGGVQKVASVFEFLGDNAIPIAAGAAAYFVPTIGAAATAMWAAAPAGWAAVAPWIAAQAPLIALVGLATALGWLVDKIEWGQVAENFSYMWEDIKTKAGEFKDWAFGLGKQLIDGFVEGIKAYYMAPVEAVRWLMNQVIGSGEKTLDVGSPSKEFEKLGMFSGQGFAQGMEASMPAANDVFPEFMTASSRMAPGEVYGGGGGARYSINQVVNVYADGADAEAVTEGARKGARDGLEDLLRQLAEEAA
jgi:tape measure domain-containing protein